MSNGTVRRCSSSAWAPPASPFAANAARSAISLKRSVKCAGSKREDRAAVGFGDSAEGLLGTDAGAIERTAASNDTPETDSDGDAEIAQAPGVNLRRFQIITLWPQRCPFLERIADNDKFHDGELFGFLGHVTQQSGMLGPTRPVLDRGYGARQLLCVAVPRVRSSSCRGCLEY
jgi:hypothetical protein